MSDTIQHELVPKHEILSPAEKKELLEKLGATELQLPRIFDSDAVAKAMKAKPGDVLRIIRKSETAGQAIYYRIVE